MYTETLANWGPRTSLVQSDPSRYRALKQHHTGSNENLMMIAG